MWLTCYRWSGQRSRLRNWNCIPLSSFGEFVKMISWPLRFLAGVHSVEMLRSSWLLMICLCVKLFWSSYVDLWDISRAIPLHTETHFCWLASSAMKTPLQTRQRKESPENLRDVCKESRLVPYHPILGFIAHFVLCVAFSDYPPVYACRRLILRKSLSFKYSRWNDVTPHQLCGQVQSCLSNSFLKFSY